MYNLIRLFIGCIVWCCLILVLKKSKANHKRKLYIFSVIIIVIFITILSFIPFENLFTTFNSPEEVFNYYNGSKSDIKHVVNGKDSDLVIADNNNTDVYLIVPKTASGWKIGIGINTKRILQKIHDGIIIYVYQYNNTDDYFVTILDSNGGDAQIADSCNSMFSSLERNNISLGKTFLTYYANIRDFTQQYWISINGEEIALNNQ